MEVDPKRLAVLINTFMPDLKRQGFYHIGGGDFVKEGKVYDLSAADLTNVQSHIDRGAIKPKGRIEYESD